MTFLLSATYDIVPEKDSILPPLTSKVPKYILEKSPSISPLIRNKTKYKGLTISPLKRDGQYLYSIPNSPVNVAKSGTKMSFHLSFSTQDIDPSIFYIDEIQDTPYGKFYITLNQIEVKEMINLSFKINDFFVIRFETPTLLSNKYMLPPPLKRKNIKAMNKLIPQPSLIFSFLTSLWNSIAEPKEKIIKGDLDWTPYMIGRISDVIFTELGYSIKPITVILGKDSHDNLREARGFIGWTKYKVTHYRNYIRIMERLLGLASIMGIGRSRGIGLGIVKILNQGQKVLT
ncbi:CRISPR system precrRNA processing endoribonuclease RAMP protein Cas6 [Acidianus brierleyi]|uniref:Uncharacterized protein n=1 Tax=Acidianus brierleyi TaxID=41673 RepID=A0A2U9IGP9_9CREN|nr:CRISPR system precrRNA processing endoribonuclease RAMP protein Cas6 [Acidianus brierleyi]AWR95227.1 CRISPR system precrRNA processing endoribonuclease RAMP protein Cas6 [Acidianus brierleyi]